MVAMNFKDLDTPHTCRDCGEDDITKFRANLRAKNGLQPLCATCMGKHMRAGLTTPKPLARPRGRSKGSVAAKTTAQPSATASVSTPIAMPVAAPVSNAPVFVTFGDFDVALSSVGLVDKSNPNYVDVVLNIHEMNQQGVVTAKTFRLFANERDTFLNSYSVATGKPITDTREIERLKAENAALKRDNDTALQLAQEAQARVNALKAALN
jgi:hypothetical protein